MLIFNNEGKEIGMDRTDHFRRRASERGLDEISVLVLRLYGEQLGARDGYVLRHDVATELRQLALGYRQGADEGRALCQRMKN